MNVPWILILFVATSSSSSSGAASVSTEFSNYGNCKAAGLVLAANAKERNNYVLTWGCFKK